jgi:uncharacterized damage-inducible protein DinB
MTSTVCEGGRVTTTGSAGVLRDAFDRIHQVVHRTVDGLTAEQLAHRPEGRGNSIAWLVWHLTRIQDDHVADVAGTEQVWAAKGYAADFGLPFDEAATGYGQSGDEVAAVRVTAEQLTAYFDAVHEVTTRYVATLTDDDLTRVVDENWDPPVTLGVRLVSVVSDDLQHAGQAAYVRGLISAS